MHDDTARLPNQIEAANAAALLLRCNGHDLDIWSDGNWPVDADEFLRPISSRMGVQDHGTSTKDLAFALDLVEQRFPGSFWHMAKGRVRGDEPLFAFQVLFGTDEVLGEGEGDNEVSAIMAALALPTPPQDREGEL